MRHDDFDDGEILHAVQRFCKVTEEEPAESRFDIIPTGDVEDATNVAIEGGEITGREIPTTFNEDISNFRAQGFSVDDDNDPAPENIPTPAEVVNGRIYRAWGSEPIDARRVLSHQEATVLAKAHQWWRNRNTFRIQGCWPY